MPWRLRDNLHWCVCGGRAIFLDVEADRYFCLSPSTDAAFLRLAGGGQLPGDLDLLHSLLKRRLLIEDSIADRMRTFLPISHATGDFQRDPSVRPRPFEILELLASEIKASCLLRTMPLLDVVKNAALPCPTDDKSTRRSRTLHSLVRSASEASLFLRATDRCLPRALAVQKICRSRGIETKLIFGVRTNPFGAHSWVQLGECVIVGDFEQVRLYTPIAVFG